MEAFWSSFCSTSGCSSQVEAECSMKISGIFNPSSCINHILVIAIDVFLSFVFILILLCKSSSSEKNVLFPRHFTCLMISMAGANGGLSLCYLGLAVWKIYESLNEIGTVLPLHVWLVVLSQGITWLILCLTVSFKKLPVRHATSMKFCTLVASLYAGFICILSVREVIVDGVVSVKGLLDILSFPGGILMLIYAVSGQNNSTVEGGNSDVIYEPLLENEANSNTIDERNDGNENVTPFAKAGFFSKTSFWWLNPLMKKGKQKVLQQDDVPLLGPDDRAGRCYSRFMEEVHKQKKESYDKSSVLWAIFNTQRKAILITGFFALVKVLTLATGPLFLMAFIKVAQGEAGFEYEVYVLTAGLLLSKCVETLSERQWNFRCRLIGLQVRSFLSGAICKKQLQLSNAAKMSHSPGEIVNNVLVDAYQIGEFPYWFHQIWSTSLQLVLALLIVYYAVGLAMVAALVVIIATVLLSSPMAKLQQKYQRELVETQDRMLKAIAEALGNMKVLKLYAWETHFKNVIEGLRKDETEWTRAVLAQKGYYMVLYWSSPVLVPACTFWACYFLGIPLTVSNVFTFLASLRIVQEPIRMVPDVVAVFVQANVSLSRIIRFLNATELEHKDISNRDCDEVPEDIMLIKASEISWSYEMDSTKTTLRNINLEVRRGEKVAVCGEVGSGKSTLLAAILGEVPHVNGTVNGTVRVCGKTAYVSQTAWIQTGTIKENILFGSPMDPVKYQETIRRCSLVKDVEMLPFGDRTLIGERGVNLSGGQKQRIQLARALYQDADLYLLDDPFSAVDAHTAASLFNEYVMGALSKKTVLLVTHQVDFLPTFTSILMMSSGEILGAGSYDHLMASCPEFRELVNAHSLTSGAHEHELDSSGRGDYPKEEIQNLYTKELLQASQGDQLIKQEERETGDTGLKPYIQYLKHKNGLSYFTLATISHIIFIIGQLIQNYWLALDIDNSAISTLELNTVYTAIGISLALFLLLRSYFTVLLGVGASESMFNTLIYSLFRAPMSFYDSTPVGRILSRVSSDLNIIDTDVPFKMAIALGSTMIAYSSFLILVLLSWQIVFIIAPMIYLTIVIQKYYLATSKELMRLDGTTKSIIASHLSESIAGATTIRAFGLEDRFFIKGLDLIDANASPYFHNFAANEWLILRLEIVCAIVLSSSALAITLLHRAASASGFIGMALTYGLSLNVFLVVAIQFQCSLSNLIVSVERLEQYMHIPGEAPEVIEDSRPAQNWPSVGKVVICDLKVRYRPEAPLVLHGITCTIQGGHKVGIVGRTGSGKTTLISTLFRLVEPTEGKIIIDDINITAIGLHDLRSHFGVIPQDPTLFGGTVRYNLDPLSEHTDEEIWDVLGKCQLRETIQQKEKGLDSLVVQDGSNWSMGQRQLFCLGRALLRRSRILVLDEATASIDNATDSILQRTIRGEFADCTVITVAHRIPTVMDCTMVLAISDGKLVEYDEPMKLTNKEDSLFGQLYKEYWSRSANSRS